PRARDVRPLFLAEPSAGRADSRNGRDGQESHPDGPLSLLSRAVRSGQSHCVGGRTRLREKCREQHREAFSPPGRSLRAPTGGLRTPPGPPASAAEVAPGARTGPRVPGRRSTAASVGTPLRRAPAGHHPRGWHVVPALPAGPRETRPRVFHRFVLELLSPRRI